MLRVAYVDGRGSIWAAGNVAHPRGRGVILRSDDGGDSFETAFAEGGDSSGCAVTVSGVATDTAKTMLAVGNIDCPSEHSHVAPWLSISGDGGTTWDDVAADYPMQRAYWLDDVIATPQTGFLAWCAHVHAKRSLPYDSSDFVFRSVNGRQWTEDPVSDFRGRRLRGGTATSLYAESNHAIFRSSDGGRTWSPSNVAMPAEPLGGLLDPPWGGHLAWGEALHVLPE